MAGDVIGLLDHLGISRVSLVGWSDGGCTGFDLALNHPER
jgi:pimeloyl-ACP methyl ester carboxylesterase